LLALLKSLSGKYAIIKEFVDNWRSLMILADAKVPVRKHNPTRRKNVWRQVDTSPPILIKGEVWFVRTIYHVVEDRLYYDVRKWKDVSNNFAYKYATTEDGLTLDAETWPLLLSPLFKQFEQHTLKEKKRK
jgi:hypothetical protein